MKKETLIAIIFGIAFGVIVSLVMISKTKEKQLESKKTLTKENTISPTVMTNNNSVQSIEIIEPQDKAIFNKKTITISGKASKDALIVIQSPAQEVVIKSKTDKFSTDFPLALGENVIQIAVYPKDQQLRAQQKELRIYYLDEQ